MRRIGRGLVAAVAATIVSAGVIGASVEAGGWAVTVVDPFDQPAAGEDLEVAFTILQHGRTPVDVADVVMVVEEPGGATERFAAQFADGVGRYTATIELPDSGRYRWSVIQGWFGPQDLGELNVPAAAGVAWVLPVAIIAGLALLVVGGAVAWRLRRQPVSVRVNPQASWM